MKQKGHGFSRCSILVSSLLLCLAPLLCVNQKADARDKGTGGRHVCIGCHRVAQSLISASSPFPEAIDPSSLCLDCHNYQDNHHPVNFRPGLAEGGNGLNSFPLFDGEMRCLTCHEVHGSGGPKLLRGGPYTSRTEICFRCHDSNLNATVDPHQMLTPGGSFREVNGEPACLLCHARVPDRTGAEREIAFKADVAFLCWRCHPPMDGSFFQSHFLVRPGKKALAYMKAAERENGVSLPLLNRDRITCSTCHNPHQQGVILSGPAAAGAGEHDRLRLSKDQICNGCHPRY